MCKKLKLDPKSRIHLSICALFFCFGFQLLSHDAPLLWHRSYYRYITGFASLWTGIKEKQPHGIPLKINVNNISPKCPVPWKPLTGVSPPQGSHRVFGFHDFWWMSFFSMRRSSLSFQTSRFARLAHYDWLIGKLCTGAGQWLNKHMSLEAAWYLSHCCFPHLKQDINVLSQTLWSNKVEGLQIVASHIQHIYCKCKTTLRRKWHNIACQIVRIARWANYWFWKP